MSPEHLIESPEHHRRAPLRRVFSRLAMPVSVGDLIEIDEIFYEVETCNIASDLRDAKCGLVERHDHAWGPWIEDPVGVLRKCTLCSDVDWHPEG